MALVVADRVKETTTSTGTGAITLAGAEPNFRTFSSVLSDADTTYYAIIDDSNLAFEVGLGTYASSGNTITRTTVLSSSNSNNAVNFSAGTKDVFLNYPADKAVYLDANGAAVGVNASPSITATASGAIANGDMVIMKSDGNVASVSGVKESISTPAQFETGGVVHLAVAYDANADRYVFAYEDQGNSQYGTAVVGQLNTSDDTWTFGTAVVFESAQTDKIDIVYDPDTQRVVIAYIDDANNDYLTAIVGQVDNTDNSISFGTAVVAAGEDSNYPRIDYDTDQDRVVLAWFATYPKAIAGAVTGGATNSITFGSAVNVDASSNRAPIGLAFDNNANKHLYVYGRSASNGEMEAGILDLSGSTITVDSTLEIFAGGAQTAGRGTTVFDSNVNKFVSFFQDVNTKGLISVVCSISGTDIVVESSASHDINPSAFMKAAFDSNSNTIAFSNAAGISGSRAGDLAVHTGRIGSDGVFTLSEKETRVDTQDLTPTYTSMCFDSTNNVFAVAFVDRGTSPNPGKVAVYKAPSGNLTEGNFLGISDAAYSDAATATIQLVGSVDDAQSGLTAGQEYYVLSDGSLSTDSREYPNVRVGLATSATEIAIKG